MSGVVGMRKYQGVRSKWANVPVSQRPQIQATSAQRTARNLEYRTGPEPFQDSHKLRAENIAASALLRAGHRRNFNMQAGEHDNDIYGPKPLHIKGRPLALHAKRKTRTFKMFGYDIGYEAKVHKSRSGGAHHYYVTSSFSHYPKSLSFKSKRTGRTHKLSLLGIAGYGLATAAPPVGAYLAKRYIGKRVISRYKTSRSVNRAANWLRNE
jgi:hypothetical protein